MINCIARNLGALAFADTEEPPPTPTPPRAACRKYSPDLGPSYLFFYFFFSFFLFSLLSFFFCSFIRRLFFAMSARCRVRVARGSRKNVGYPTFSICRKQAERIVERCYAFCSPYGIFVGLGWWIPWGFFLFVDGEQTVFGETGKMVVSSIFDLRWVAYACLVREKNGFFLWYCLIFKNYIFV